MVQVFELAKELGFEKTTQLNKALLSFGSKEYKPLEMLDSKTIDEIKRLLKDNKFEKESPEKPEINKALMDRGWKPARVLEVPENRKNPGVVHYWADKSDQGRIEEMEAEGWVVDCKAPTRTEHPETIKDGRNLDSTVQRRELILMKMPKEVAEARRKYFEEKNNSALKASVDHYRNQVKDQDGRPLSYGKVQVY